MTEEIKVEELDLEEEVMDELKVADAPKKAKKEKVAKVPALAENEIGAGGVAEMLKVDPRTFRGFLRKHFRNMEVQKGQRYKWVKDSPELQEVIDAYAASKVKVEKPAKVAKDAKVTATPIADIDETDVEELTLD